MWRFADEGLYPIWVVDDTITLEMRNDEAARRALEIVTLTQHPGDTQVRHVCNRPEPVMEPLGADTPPKTASTHSREEPDGEIEQAAHVAAGAFEALPKELIAEGARPYGRM